MPDRPPRPARAEPRDTVELKQLKTTQPELASAIDMQIALNDMQRRVQSRVPTPWFAIDPEWARAQVAGGRPLVVFANIPIEWSDFRLTFRQTADILQRFDAIDREEHEAILALGRESALQPLVERWYLATSGVEGGNAADRAPAGAPANLDHVLVLALRPFLARCAEVLMQRTEIAEWHHGHCPCCGWEPDFAVVAPSGERRLICGRCLAQWGFGAFTCPFCKNDDKSLVTSFATRDGRYRVYACDVCRRYLKAYDARNAQRPVMVSVDVIATLPLDAAAMQRGYVG